MADQGPTIVGNCIYQGGICIFDFDIEMVKAIKAMSINMVSGMLNGKPYTIEFNTEGDPYITRYVHDAVSNPELTSELIAFLLAPDLPRTLTLTSALSEVNIISDNETKKQRVIKINAPGLSASDIRVHIDEGNKVLLVFYNKRERFIHRFKLSDKAGSHVDASIDRDIISIIIPSKARRVQFKE
jgi:hypothetical protein